MTRWLISSSSYLQARPDGQTQSVWCHPTSVMSACKLTNTSYFVRTCYSEDGAIELALLEAHACQMLYTSTRVATIHARLKILYAVNRTTIQGKCEMRASIRIMTKMLHSPLARSVRLGSDTNEGFLLGGFSNAMIRALAPCLECDCTIRTDQHNSYGDNTHMQIF